MGVWVCGCVGVWVWVWVQVGVGEAVHITQGFDFTRSGERSEVKMKEMGKFKGGENEMKCFSLAGGKVK